MGLRAGLDWCGKSHPTGLRSPDRPARRQSLHRLRYPAHKYSVTSKIFRVFGKRVLEEYLHLREREGGGREREKERRQW